MIATGQLILALSILIILHELGHFLPAKWFKMRVDKFYLFFDPWFSLLKFKKGGTEYGIGWLPLGGYVRIAGMVDESMKTKDLALEPQPWEFRAKPAWQRLVVMLGGVTVNVILAFIIFSGVTYVWGDEIQPLNKERFGVYVDPVLRDVGFQNGDKVIAMDGQGIGPQVTYQDVSWAILMNDVRIVTVRRGRQKVEVTIPDDIGERVMENKEPKLLVSSFPFVVDSVLPNYNADLAGLKKGDRVVQINETPINSFMHAVEILQNNKKEFVDLKVQRKDLTLNLKTYVSTQGRVGVYPYVGREYFNTEIKKFGVFESLGRGAFMTKDLFVKNILQFKLLFNKNGTQHIGSVLSMRQQFGDRWDWYRFWMLTANLSLVLAFFNLLPIPGLDGGHALFLIVEIVSGKKPSTRFMEVTQVIGMVLLLSLMVFALGNDVYNGKL